MLPREVSSDAAAAHIRVSYLVMQCLPVKIRGRRSLSSIPLGDRDCYRVKRPTPAVLVSNTRF